LGSSTAFSDTGILLRLSDLESPFAVLGLGFWALDISYQVLLNDKMRKGWSLFFFYIVVLLPFWT